MGKLRPSAQLYIAGITVAALLATAYALSQAQLPSPKQLTLAVGFLAVLVVALLHPLPFAFKTKVHMETAVIVAAILLLEPGPAMVVAGAGMFIAQAIERRERDELLFNGSQYVLQAGAGGFILSATGWNVDTQPFDGPIRIASIALAGVSTQLVSTVAVATIIGLQSNVSPVRVWYRTTIRLDRTERLSLLAQMGLGVLGAVVAFAHSWALPLLLLPAVVVYSALQRHILLRQEAEANLAAAQRIARLGSWDWNVDTGEMIWSDEVFRIFGRESGTFMPTYQHFLDAVHPEDRDYVEGRVRETFEERDSFVFEHRIVRDDGTERAVLEQGGVIHDDEGRPVRLVGTVNDVTERKALESRLEHQAYHDALTGLPNRAMLANRLAQSLARSARRGEYVAVMFLDLDRFKSVNDTLGHEAGDELLVQVAERLRLCLRPGDTLARLGGDEFTVLLEGIGHGAEAEDVARRIIVAIEAPFSLGGKEAFVGTSVGIALGAPGAVQPEDLMRDADTAMYEAKRTGRGRYEVFDPSMDASERLGLLADLRRALDRGELRLRYQPTVDLRSHRLVGFEALVRWAHPERGEIAPGEFVPLAEEAGLIVPIGTWVLRAACAQASEWNRGHGVLASGTPVAVSVNISAKQLAQPRFVETVDRILSDTGLPPSSLKLEITESVLVQHLEQQDSAIERLRRRGIRVALDDFGTGYSSLSYLKRLPVDALKLDKSFVDGLGEHPADWAIVRTVLGLGSALGLEVVAEGVEQEAQAEELRALGCEFAQGYLFSPPLEPADAEQLLTARSQVAERLPTLAVS